eukprot:TRINITY_DN16889_c0_g1_i1.p1 TRINITY_DN16889_c0_g1~~TRINITY_DN16889_c0_g1_i1.p1  ORF type:complete len:325 (-),score=52.99 TRINITY_DN16889_c0_g1_i1:32-1006(-)
MSECGRVVTICSNIPRLAQCVQALLPKMKVVSVSPPLDQTICQTTDFLIAEHNFLEPLLTSTNKERLKFVQNTWAGMDSMAKHVKETDCKPTLKLARFSHPSFSQFMAEYALVSIINMERNYPLVHASQAQGFWNKCDDLKNYRCLNELKIGILGVGKMGKCTAKIFKSFGSEVYGLVSSTREPSDCIDKYFVPAELSELLSSVDYVVNILPATPDTDQILGGGILSHCKNVGFVNIGRGNVIKEEEIIEALENGWLRGAALDVFNVEPLPSESKLWSHPKVTITPHVAGESRAKDIAECFVRNLNKFDSGEDLDCVVNWDRLY